MAKKRVFEAAKELRISTRELIRKLQAAGVDVRNNFSAVTDEDIYKVTPAAQKTRRVPAPEPTEAPAPPPKEPEKPREIGRKDEQKKTITGKVKLRELQPPEKKENKEKEGGTQENIYASPSKRLEAIRKRGMERERKGTKVTFLRKRSGKKTAPERAAAAGEQAEEVKGPPKTIRVQRTVTVKELSKVTGVKSAEIIKFLMQEMGIMATINQSLDADVAALVGERFNFKLEVKEEQEPELEEQVEDKPESLAPRPPVVTIMGHVDHGKTRLLDTIRKTNVRGTEFGGITQHIGAYQVIHNDRKITFLDTPGHESFTAMRARGAKVTDLAVLVVAADDGVMPQTMEAIDHARAAGVPILVAVNKIDKPQANAEKTMRQLAEKGLTPEDWGGDTVFVSISAKMGTNIAELLDMIFLVTDIQELKANPKRRAEGSIIEARLDKGKGPVATALVQNGTLYVGDSVLAGMTSGKIRAMENDLGERVPMADASTPVKIYGLHSVPQAGDRMVVVDDEKKARDVAQRRQVREREEKMHYANRVTLQEIFQKIQDGHIKELNILVKGDFQGSVEAVTEVLKDIKHEEVRVKIIRSAVGDIKETDVMLAAASSAIIMGFQVSMNPNASVMANREKVEVRFYDVIYKLVEDVEQALVGMLAPETVEEHVGRAEVLKIFQSTKSGAIAGSRVTDGEISMGDEVKIMREGRLVHQGSIQSLRRFKDSARSVKQGFECGITIAGAGDIQEGDQMEIYRLVEKRRESLSD
ncbi:MAG: translation initiation factor IF-2 [bacterium]